MQVVADAAPALAGAHRKRLHKSKTVKVPNPFNPVTRIKPTVRHVTEIVPQNIIPKLKPTPPRPRLH
jgi:hypothetical protein